MTPFFMPTLGSELRLDSSWTFQLHNEGRNHDVFAAYGLVIPNSNPNLRGRYWDEYQLDPGSQTPTTNRWNRTGWATITLPALTQMRLDRIYVRKGSEDFDSLTWCITDCSDPRLRTRKHGGFAARQPRFWHKLGDLQGVGVTWIKD